MGLGRVSTVRHSGVEGEDSRTSIEGAWADRPTKATCPWLHATASSVLYGLQAIEMIDHRPMPLD